MENDKENVMVPKDLLAEVLDTAEGDSFSTQAEFSCRPSEDARYEAQREKINQLREYAHISSEATVGGQGFFGIMLALSEKEKPA